MQQILDCVDAVIDPVMDMAAELGPMGGVLAAIALTAILVWITGRFLRIG